jgi:hypothetical protein
MDQYLIQSTEAYIGTWQSTLYKNDLVIYTSQKFNNLNLSKAEIINFCAFNNIDCLALKEEVKPFDRSIQITLLERAQDILHNRSEEKDRQYGSFTESIERTAKIASLMGNKEITENDVYNVLIALKLARESNAHKSDNILDAVVYLAQKDIVNNK